MPKIKNEDLEGRIKELHSEHNLEFYTTSNFATAKKWISQISENVDNAIAVDIETSGFDGVRDNMLGIVIAISLKKSIYVDTRDWADKNISKLVELINSLPNNKIAHNMFFDVGFIELRYGVKLRIEKDTMIYAFCLYTDRVYYNEGIGLKDLSRDFTPYGNYEDELMDYKKLYCRQNKIKIRDFSYDMFPKEILNNYAHMDGIATIYLYNLFEKTKLKLIEGGWEKLQSLLDIKHEITYIYTDMHVTGFKVDRKKAYELKNQWENKREELEKELLSLSEISTVNKIIKRKELIRAQSKRKSLLPLSRCRKLWKTTNFNLSSNDHKKILFYDVLKLDVVEKTDKGQPATGASVISHYSEKGNEFMKKLDSYVRLNKGITSFIGEDDDKGILGLTSDDHPFVHPNYNHCGVVSSRTAGSSPCLMQTPSRGELKVIKKCYVVEEDRKLIGFDYSSAEVRIVTALSQEPNFIEAVNNGWDFHSNTVYNIFKDRIELPEELITKKEKLDYIKNNYPQLRQYAKGTLFGLIYGIQSMGLSKNLGVTKTEAQEIINSFFKGNTVLKTYLDDVLKSVYKTGYVENFWGQRIYFRNVKKFNPFSSSRNKNWKALSEFRLSNNVLVQSGNAFIMYEGMIKLNKKIKELGIDVKMLTTIYDAIYFDVSEKEDLSSFIKLLKECFEVEFKGTKMTIDISGSPDRTWYSWEVEDLNEL